MAFFLYYDVLAVLLIFVCATLQLSLVKIADFQFYKYDEVRPAYEFAESVRLDESNSSHSSEDDRLSKTEIIEPRRNSFEPESLFFVANLGRTT
jgi:hypothetical protein